MAVWWLLWCVCVVFAVWPCSGFGVVVWWLWCGCVVVVAAVWLVLVWYGCDVMIEAWSRGALL